MWPGNVTTGILVVVHGQVAWLAALHVHVRVHVCGNRTACAKAT